MTKLTWWTSCPKILVGFFKTRKGRHFLGCHKASFLHEVGKGSGENCVLPTDTGRVGGLLLTLMYTRDGGSSLCCWHGVWKEVEAPVGRKGWEAGMWWLLFPASWGSFLPESPWTRPLFVPSFTHHVFWKFTETLRWMKFLPRHHFRDEPVTEILWVNNVSKYFILCIRNHTLTYLILPINDSRDK